MKSIPVRTCIGCRYKKPKFLLLRFTLDKNKKLFLDIKQTHPGRGAYVCFNLHCLEKALKHHRFYQALGKECGVDNNALIKEVKSLSTLIK